MDPRTVAARFIAPIVLLASVALAQDKPVVQNAGFEEMSQATPDAAGLVAGWKVVGQGQIPASWSLNSHYTGSLEMRTDDPHEGKAYVRMTGGENSGHLYQMLAGLQPGKWYKVSLWSRGSQGGLSTYNYQQDGKIGGSTIGWMPAGSQWRQLVGYYHVPPTNFREAALAISVANGQTLDVDDVTIAPLEVPTVSDQHESFSFENDTCRFAVNSLGLLTEFMSKATGQSYLGEAAAVPMVTLMRQGHDVPTFGATRNGDRLTFRFLEPEVSATIRITPRKTHFLFEVVEVQPADVDELAIQIPMKRLAKLGWAFGANYDDTFGACFFCASINSHNRATAGATSVVLGGACERTHKLVGAKFVLIGAPAKQFRQAVIDAEKANNLPCPVVGGKWVRDSESIRKSYLFAVACDATHVDKLIEYAKIGGFGTLIFGIGDWSENNGHYEINKTKFPGGTAAMRKIVDKIHAAGLEAGIHLFGPSISPNDPYITPKPDPRLAGVVCPPLAAAIDETATTIILTGQPNLPPKTLRTQATPGYHIQIGDEIVRYSDIIPVEGQPDHWQFTGCARGQFGSTAAAHEAGAAVKGLITLWGYFAIDPDSTLADEVTTNWAKVFNACNFDFVYFDASDGLQTDYVDRWYYLNKFHTMYFQKLGRGCLYQTSNGTGGDLVWHVVPRSASADGHGDIKGYLDDRWPGILGMGDNWTKADIGWYYWFSDVRPDQIEYVCARALGIDGSISLETSPASTDGLTQSRQMYEMIGRWERARRANVFSPAVKAKLLEMGKDFKLFQDSKGGWQLYRAAYEEPRVLDVVNGIDNVFTIKHDGPAPCLLGFELVRPGKGQPMGDYDDPQAKTVETFDETQPYYASDFNEYEPFVVGDKKTITPLGIVREGTEFSFALTQDARAGKSALQMKASNNSDAPGWTGIGRRFPEPLDLRGFKGAALWIKGDANGETIRVQFRDAAGQSADFLPVIGYQGWRLHFFPLPETGFDWSKVAYLLFYFNGLPPHKSVDVTLDDLKLVPALHEPPETGSPLLTVNGRTIRLPQLPLGQAITHEGVGGIKVWPGGMKPPSTVKMPVTALQLQPGDNTVTVGWSDPATFPGNLQVLVYRVWEME